MFIYMCAKETIAFQFIFYIYKAGTDLGFVEAQKYIATHIVQISLSLFYITNSNKLIVNSFKNKKHQFAKIRYLKIIQTF